MDKILQSKYLEWVNKLKKKTNKIQQYISKGVDQDGGRLGQILTFSHKFIKIHLHVEQFLQKIYWSLGEDLRVQKGEENLYISG